MWESSPELCLGCDVSSVQSMVSQLCCLWDNQFFGSHWTSVLLLCLTGSELQVSDSLPCEWLQQRVRAYRSFRKQWGKCRSSSPGGGRSRQGCWNSVFSLSMRFSGSVCGEWLLSLLSWGCGDAAFAWYNTWEHHMHTQPVCSQWEPSLSPADISPQQY